MSKTVVAKYSHMGEEFEIFVDSDLAYDYITGTALKIITELSESINNGQMNITLTESITPTIIGGKVLLQVGVISLNEQAVKQVVEG